MGVFMTTGKNLLLYMYLYFFFFIQRKEALSALLKLKTSSMEIQVLNEVQFKI